MSKKEIPREPEKTKLTRAQRKEIEAVIRKYKGDGKPHTAQATIPYGQPHVCVDEYMKRRLEIKLISSIVTIP